MSSNLFSNIFKTTPAKDISLTMTTKGTNSRLTTTEKLATEVGYITTSKVDGLKDTGCLIVLVESSHEGGPNGIFMLARSNKTQQGVVNRLCHSPGGNGDELHIEWNPYEHPHVLIRHKFQLYKPHQEMTFSIRVIRP